MNKIKNALSKPWVAYAFATCSAVILFLFLTNLPSIGAWIKKVLSFLSPLITGVIIAYLLNPASEFFKRKVFKKVKKESTKHLLSVIMTITILILVLIIIIGSFVPSLVKSISTIISNWDSYVAVLEGLIDKVKPLAEKFNIDLSNLTSLTSDLMSKALNFIQENKTGILGTLSSAGSSVSNFAIGVLFGVCFLIAKKTLLSIFSKIRFAVLKKETIKKQDELFGRFHRIFIKYVACTLMDALIIGICVLIFVLILNPGYAPLIAVIAAFTNIIPTIGPMIGAGIALFFLVLETPINALWYFIFICLLQGLDGLVIKPRLFKGSLGVPGVWTFVFMIIGGKVAGMLGIILSIPIVAILVIIYNESVVPKLKKREIKINKAKS